MSQNRSALILIIVAALSALVWCPRSLALDPLLDVRQYAHNTWSFRDGFLKGPVYAFAQTPDGYLWMGTALGVIRFDGVRAVPLRLPPGQQLPSTAVWTLLAARDGTLWIGTPGGLASWKNGFLTHYPPLAGYFVEAILEDREGTVWAGGSGTDSSKLCAIRNGLTNCSDTGGDLGRAVRSLYEDADGILWIGAATGVWRWKPGPPSRWISEPITDRGSLTQGDHRSGVIVAMNNVRQIDGKGIMDYPLDSVPSPLNASNIFRDRNGGLWIGTRAHGLVHSYQGKTSIITNKDGLSSDQVFAVFEDREGTVWVATDNGLDRFRESPVSSLSEWQGRSSAPPTSILAARDGSIWIGTMDGLKRWKDGQMTLYRTRNAPSLPGDSIKSLFEDEGGRLWVSGDRGLAVFEGGRFTAVPVVPSGDKHAIAGDDHGGLWLSLWLTPKGEGLVHLSKGKIIEQISWEDVGGGPGSGLVADPDGGVWTGLITGGIAHFRDGRVDRLALSDPTGNASRVVNLFRGRDGALWAATENGLARIKNGNVTMLTVANGLPCNAVHWIIEDDVSYYWLYTRCGLLRIARTELDAWTAEPKGIVQPMVFEGADGIQLIAFPSAARPAVTKAPDGKIWFLNGHSVSVIDPSHVGVNKLPPPVTIEQITANDKAYDVKPGLRLPPLVRDLSIDYTALSLIAPEKVRFRYKLEGQDPDWIEVVNRRQVQYSNLPPGNYRFRVTASNNSGVWNEEGALLDFSISPVFYQTTWFRLACVALFLALLCVGYQLRLRQLAHGFNMTLEARVNERTRIARELHDTLLQSFQGLLLRFQSVLKILPERPLEARQRLESAVDQAAAAIAEGRDAVRGLRSSAFETNDLANSIIALGQELTSDASAPDSPTIAVEVEGTPRNLNPIVRDEAYRIACEALRNAFWHSQARRISVEIRYEKLHFRLRVCDDGKGMDDETIRRGHGGHFGLPGMRERAAIVGGRLDIWSRLGSGTEVDLGIPGAVAYGSKFDSSAIIGKPPTHGEQEP
jgi:ligand-binding sensor domain-containing protein/signal transduction histidine kinase